MKIKHLPVGLQEFRDVIQEGCVYVDKTRNIHELLSAPKCPYFLSCPRRFGKSLLISTLEAGNVFFADWYYTNIASRYTHKPRTKKSPWGFSTPGAKAPRDKRTPRGDRFTSRDYRELM
ncbi:MAG: AAA family ATPase [Myxococcota bacterium]